MRAAQVHAEPLGEQSARALNPGAGEPSVEHDGPPPSPGLPNSPKWPAKFARVGGAGDGVPFAEKRSGTVSTRTLEQASAARTPHAPTICAQGDRVFRSKGGGAAAATKTKRKGRSKKARTQAEQYAAKEEGKADL